MMRDRSILITGATSGIGLETARNLAWQGATLILACRNPEKAYRVCASLLRESGNPRISVTALDLASLRSVRQCIADVRARHNRLDVLINNAGAFFLQRQETEDGFERTMATNYFGPFLLTAGLIPLLVQGSGARIVNVSSDAYCYGRLDLNDLQLTRRYDGFRAYATSKLAVQLWTQELAERLEGRGVMANSLHPGHVATNIWQLWSRLAWYQKLLQRLITAAMISPAAGAETTTYLASSPEVAGISGAYFVQRRPRRVAKPATDWRLQRELWRASEELTGAMDYRCWTTPSRKEIP